MAKKEDAMKDAKKLPLGHLRARVEIVVEGPAVEAFEKLAEIIKVLPQEQRIEAVHQIEKRLRVQRKGGT